MKRSLDFVLAALGLVLLAPVIVVVAFAIRLNLGAPIFFAQTRPGLDAKPFVMYKFRSMKNATDSTGAPLPDHERLTSFGKFIRASSLDELPELWNVLKGDMSLVGPRPLLVEYLPLYSEQQARRHEVRPGITGWAQVNGRNALSWDEKFELDVWYVDHQSILLDLRTLWKTLVAVFRRNGISQDGHATMSPFQGKAGHS
jgi:lipopolysaccharide/colanic/teichoic acid biosynthesis glycosyltransferase